MIHKNNIKKDILAFIFNKRKKKHFLNDKNIKWIKGYCFNDKVVSKDEIYNFPEIYNFNNFSISNEKIEYLFKFFNLCKKNKIKLICTRSPYPPTRYSKAHKDDANVTFSRYCKDNNIQYIDFNVENDLIYEDFDFVDYHHMNYIGANKVSKELSLKLIEL